MLKEGALKEINEKTIGQDLHSYPKWFVEIVTNDYNFLSFRNPKEAREGYKVLQKILKDIDLFYAVNLSAEVSNILKGQPQLKDNATRLTRTLFFTMLSNEIVYHPETNILEGLNRKRLDCDTSTYIFAAVFERFGMRTFPIYLPDHAYFVYEDTSNLQSSIHTIESTNYLLNKQITNFLQERKISGKTFSTLIMEKQFDKNSAQILESLNKIFEAFDKTNKEEEKETLNLIFSTDFNKSVNKISNEFASLNREMRRIQEHIGINYTLHSKEQELASLFEKQTLQFILSDKGKPFLDHYLSSFENYSELVASIYGGFDPAFEIVYLEMDYRLLRYSIDYIMNKTDNDNITIFPPYVEKEMTAKDYIKGLAMDGKERKITNEGINEACKTIISKHFVNYLSDYATYSIDRGNQNLLKSEHVPDEMKQMIDGFHKQYKKVKYKLNEEQKRFEESIVKPNRQKQDGIFNLMRLLEFKIKFADTGEKLYNTFVDYSKEDKPNMDWAFNQTLKRFYSNGQLNNNIGSDTEYYLIRTIKRAEKTMEKERVEWGINYYLHTSKNKFLVEQMIRHPLIYEKAVNDEKRIQP